MMKNLRINKELYRDGLRQLRLVGIMGMVVFCLAAILTAVGFYINSPYSNSYDVVMYIGVKDYWQVKETGLSLYMCHWILFAAFPVLTPIMIMILFNFLNHRNASDFYHSIPDTRGTLYVSYVAAIFTWLLAIIGVSTVLSIVGISMVPGYFVIWSSVPKVLFMIIACCVLVMGGIMVAKSLTGTMMSNLLVALMILFLPRVFIFSVTAIISDMLGFVAWDFSNSLLNGRYNLLVGIILSVFTGDNALNYWSSGVYTLFLGIIYLVIGYVVFNRRKSESAGHAAINLRMQGIFRLAISMTVCLLPIYFIVYNDAKNYGWTRSDKFIIVVVYVVAILTYFIYELMTTGKLKRFGKLCKGLIFLAAGNVFLIGLMWGIYWSVVNYQPEGEDIDYVRILGDSDDYFQSQLNKLKITDDTVAEITSTALKRTIEEYTREGLTTSYELVEVYTSETTTEYVTKAKYEESPTVRQEVAINCGLKTIYRDVIFTAKEWEIIAEKLSGMPEYRQVFCALPDVDNSLNIYTYHGWVDEDVEAVYEVMCEEVKEIDFADWYVGVTNAWNSDYLDMIFIYVQVPNTEVYRTVRLPILESMTKTRACYFALMGSDYVPEEDKELWKDIRTVMDTGEYQDEQVYSCSINANIQIFNDSLEFVDEVYYNLESYYDGENWVRNQWGHSLSEEKQTALLEFFDRLYEGEYPEAEAGKNMVRISVGSYMDTTSVYINKEFDFCINLTEDIQAELENLLGYSLEPNLS